MAKRKRKPLPPEAALGARLKFARQALDKAVGDLVEVSRRVTRLRARVNLLEAAASKTVEERRAIAQRALETRRARSRAQRGITVREQEAAIT